MATININSGKRNGQAGRPTASELARRKARVMEVATDLFITHGYAGTSLIDIARGAGVATRTLYQHFGDKEALFREVIFARDTAGTVAKPVVKDGDTLFEALLRTARYALEATFQPHAVGLMRLMIAESQRFPEFMRETTMSIFARFERNIEKVFIALEAAGAIPPGDLAKSATLFDDVVQGSHPLMTYTDWRAGPPSEEEMRERIEFFIRGRYGEQALARAHSDRIRLAPAS
ncbi:MAG: TetR/AcrR family transcriptional regulator [Alphaproteobacteria bacterium]|nr:TetR/AcrR family transcriptional regulator [Alphaproteobacteria bacterium]